MVTLNGLVESWQEKRLAGYVVKGVKGVKGIKNQITVDSKTRREKKQALINALEAGPMDVVNNITVQKIEK